MPGAGYQSPASTYVPKADYKTATLAGHSTLLRQHTPIEEPISQYLHTKHLSCLGQKS